MEQNLIFHNLSNQVGIFLILNFVGFESNPDWVDKNFHQMATTDSSQPTRNLIH